MNRRRFVANLAGFLAAGAIDPERLLWTPGAKTIFLPPAPLAWHPKFYAFTMSMPKLELTELYDADQWAPADIVERRLVGLPFYLPYE